MNHNLGNSVENRISIFSKNFDRLFQPVQRRSWDYKTPYYRANTRLS